MNYVSFFGSIGVGKTTIGQKVANVFDNAVFIPEDVGENVYLERFYYNMERWGFLSTLEMLLLMANQLDKIPHCAETAILDNGIAELICYATLEHKTGILSDDQFYTYRRIYQKLLELTPPMNLFVYFYCNEETQLQRIARRGRPFETSIDIVFLRKLNREYDDWADTLPQDRLLRVNTECEVDIGGLADEIERLLI